MNVKAKGLIDRSLLRTTSLMGSLPLFVRRNRWKILLIFTLFTAAMVPGLGRIVLDQSMESFFKRNDSAITTFNRFKRTFGSDEYILIMYSPPDGDIFSKNSLSKVKALEDHLNRLRLDPLSPLSRITRIRSIISADYLESRGDTLINRKFIGEKIPGNSRESDEYRKLALAQREYPGSFFSRDSKKAIIQIQTDFGTRTIDKGEIKRRAVPGSAKGQSEEFDFDTGGENTESTIPEKGELEKVQFGDYTLFMKELKSVIREHRWGNSVITGKKQDNMDHIIAGNPWLMDFFNDLINSDMEKIFSLSLLIIIISLGLLFRSLWAMVWPTLIIILSTIWTLGLSGWLGITQSMMMNIVIFLILTVGIAASIHILSGYRYFTSEGYSSMDALRMTFNKSGVSISLAGITTMAGLSSLLVVPIVPIENFAVTGTIGILFAFFGTLVLLPLFISFRAPKNSKIEKADLKETGGRKKLIQVELFFQKLLEMTAGITEKNPKVIITVFLGIMILSLTGYPRVKVDTNMAKMIKPGFGIEDVYRTIDRYFGGASSVEIVIDTGKQDGIKELSILRTMENLDREITSQRSDFVTRTYSLVKAARESHKVLTDGSEDNYRLPGNNTLLKQILLMYESADPDTRKLLVDDEWRTGRLTLQVYNKSSYEYTGFMDDVNSLINKHFTPLKKEFPGLRVSITGNIPLMMQLLSFISISQIKSFGLVLAVVCLVLLILYGSLRFGLIALVPNIFPILVVLGVTGWMNIPLDSDTLLVMPIAIGIAVDDTIHFLTHYRTELLNGKSARDAIKISLREVGQAMMFTSIILSLGFLIFVSSIYIPLNNFGILSAIAIAAALLADLFLLPALLILYKPNGKKIRI